MGIYYDNQNILVDAAEVLVEGENDVLPAVKGEVKDNRGDVTDSLGEPETLELQADKRAGDICAGGNVLLPTTIPGSKVNSAKLDRLLCFALWGSIPLTVKDLLTRGITIKGYAIFDAF